MELTGCGTALVTPFRADGELDESSLNALVDWQIDSGIDFLVACGTTGETPTLNDQEWLKVIRIVAGAAGGRVPVWAGCTHNATREAVAKAKAAAEVPGVTAVLTANPYYNRPTQEGQFQHFKAVADAVPLPVVLYNIPSRTGANLEPATIARLAEAAPNIEAVKESSGQIGQITELIHQLPLGFKVFAGDDPLALPVISVGGAGLISVASNEIPAEMATMVRAALSNDWDAARSINRKYFRLMQANFWETSPGPVKAVLAMMGRLSEAYRLPMVPVAPATRHKLECLVEELGLRTHAPQQEADQRTF
ncbi:4-hydroxy-tetrahydrodipicolinate synthase [Acidisarcina polymorpha]|uniref:4-hydroxy-tetrahydrodipicolinate synthase n=1 Tax=Acidisarcina polymorpha TaxID=2211140 RepID=A0A2Z5FUT6_9BACT|nr:4-hydroxy-tetrahydrodipicolinate synthase [Acidisarcina polymorpha]AXC10510.1 4-hydroxy-tetrahydrodipicolinate synthase [Acidisarcina polymorpha]